MAESVRNEILRCREEMVNIRRDFHRHPELGFQEHRTAGVIAEYLKGLGLPVRTGVAKTGVVALLSGRSPGKTLLIRADMDALPIQEQNEVPYRSEINGVMHACGHDGHMAVAMLLAKILSRRREDLAGQIKFVFEPGEEGFAGAKEMVDEGVLTDPKVDAAIGFHLQNSDPLGRVLLRSGPAMASMDSFTVEIRGRGGHAAMPDEAVDAILISAHALVSLQSLVSRESSPLTPLVVHVGTIHGGRAFNVVADAVELKGTVRTLDQALRETMAERMERIVSNTVAAFRGTSKVDYRAGYPPLVNDPAMVGLVRREAERVVGKEQTLIAPAIMASDDMGFFLREIPGCFFFVGSANEGKGLNYPHHHPKFDFDEDAMVVAAEIMAGSALAFLSNSKTL